MPSKKLTFMGSMGYVLDARLDLPDEKPIAYALYAHCFSSSKDLKPVNEISKALTSHGFAMLRFDFTGLGRSEGNFEDTGFSSNVGDLIAATKYMRENLEAPQILIGHSFGGAAVLSAAHIIPEVKGVCTIGAPIDPAHVAKQFADSIKDIEATGESEVELVGRTFTIKKEFLDDINAQRLESSVSHLNKALLVFHSPIDDTVSLKNASRLFVAAKHPKSFISLDTADHLLTNPSDARYVGNVIASWAMRYLP